MAHKLKVGNQHLMSPEKIEDITVTSSLKNTDSLSKENIFSLGENRVYFSTKFNKEMRKVYHVWYLLTGKEKERVYAFEEENTKKCVSVLDIDKQKEGMWKVIAYDQDGQHIEGREFVIKDGKCTVLNFPKSKIKSNSVISTGLENGEPIRKDKEFSIESGPVYYYNKYEEYPEDEIIHVWYHNNQVFKKITAEKLNNKLATYSSIILPDRPSGYWKVISFNSKGQNIDFGEFVVE